MACSRAGVVRESRLSSSDAGVPGEIGGTGFERLNEGDCGTRQLARGAPG